MAYDGGLSAPHHVVIEERKSLTVSGVEDVERFDENTIVLSTSKGGDLKVEGEVDSVTYEDDGGSNRGGFLARLLR